MRKTVFKLVIIPCQLRETQAAFNALHFSSASRSL